MKKVIFENGLRAFLATFCFLLLGAVGVMAQGKLTSVPVVPGVSNPPTPTSPVYNVPTGTFIGGQQAIAKLDAELVAIKDLMLQVQQGDPSFNALLVKYRYFYSVRNHIEAGATTANAIAAGLWIFLSDVETGSVPVSTQEALKNEVIDLLN